MNHFPDGIERFPARPRLSMLVENPTGSTLPLGGISLKQAEFPIPQFFYLRLATSNICNLRCRHCHIWANTDPRNHLTVERRLDLLREIARLRPCAQVEFPGGEVTLALDELCTLSTAADRLGLRAGAVTNGFTIRVARTAQRLAESGLDRLSVSLDSHRPEVHDYVRGVAGASGRAVRALELLIAARRKARYKRHGLRIQAIAVVFDQNVDELIPYVEFCRTIGVDEVNLQLLNRTFANQNPTRDVFFERHFFHSLESKRNAMMNLRAVVERYAADPLLRTKPDDLAWFERYLHDPDSLPVHSRCAAHWRNAIIDTDGSVTLCFDRPEGVSERSIGSVRDDSLTQVLTGETARQARALMASCRKPCGALECHRDPR